MTTSRQVGQKTSENGKVKTLKSVALDQPNPAYELAMPSIALLEERRPMPGSRNIRQHNVLALQRQIGNNAIQRMLLQREDEAPAAPEGESASTEGESTEEESTEEERRRAFQEGVSTPIPADAEIGEGQATATVGGASVTILPDNTTDDEAMANRAVTTGGITSWSTPAATTQGGVVTEIEEITPPTVQIQTTYGPGASASDESGYGRGTTEADETSGDTSLGFHEGSHGQTTLDYLRDNPPPTFGGTVGMTVDEWNTACDTYDTAMEEYGNAMQAHQISSVDCVGDEADFCEAQEEIHEGHEH